MVDTHRQTQQSTTVVSYDAGLRAHMQRVYNTMAIGLVVTGLTAYGVASTPALMNFFYGSIMHWVVMLLPFAFLLFGFTPSRLQKMSVGTVSGLFFAFSATFGISLAYIFLAYSGESIARVFFITAGTFAAMSLYGYTTKKDLSGMGSFLFMGLIGIVIASLVNLFIGSETVQFVVSILGVIIFTGLTAWDTQQIKESYHVSHGHDGNAKMAVMGALRLYLDFINLFIMLLHLLGNRE